MGFRLGTFVGTQSSDRRRFFPLQNLVDESQETLLSGDPQGKSEFLVSFFWIYASQMNYSQALDFKGFIGQSASSAGGY